MAKLQYLVCLNVSKRMAAWHTINPRSGDKISPVEGLVNGEDPSPCTWKWNLWDELGSSRALQCMASRTGFEAPSLSESVAMTIEVPELRNMVKYQQVPVTVEYWRTMRAGCSLRSRIMRFDYVRRTTNEIGENRMPISGFWCQSKFRRCEALKRRSGTGRRSFSLPTSTLGLLPEVKITVQHTPFVSFPHAFANRIPSPFLYTNALFRPRVARQTNPQQIQGSFRRPTLQTISIAYPRYMDNIIGALWRVRIDEEMKVETNTHDQLRSLHHEAQYQYLFNVFSRCTLTHPSKSSTFGMH